MNTPVTASVVWTDPSGNVIPTNEARRQVIPPTGNSLVSMLLFQPIDTGLNNDGGTYTCQMIINSGNSLIASSQPTDTTLDVTVQSKFYVAKQRYHPPSLFFAFLIFVSYSLSLLYFILLSKTHILFY